MVVPFPKTRVLILPSGAGGVGDRGAGGGIAAAAIAEVVVASPGGKVSDVDRDSMGGGGDTRWGMILLNDEG
jgi:hypothetical protein